MLPRERSMPDSAGRLSGASAADWHIADDLSRMVWRGCPHAVSFAGEPVPGIVAQCARNCGAWFVWRGGRWQEK